MKEDAVAHVAYGDRLETPGPEPLGLARHIVAGICDVVKPGTAFGQKTADPALTVVWYQDLDSCLAYAHLEGVKPGVLGHILGAVGQVGAALVEH